MRPIAPNGTRPISDLPLPRAAQQGTQADTERENGQQENEHTSVAVQDFLMKEGIWKRWSCWENQNHEIPSSDSQTVRLCAKPVLFAVSGERVPVDDERRIGGRRERMPRLTQ